MESDWLDVLNDDNAFDAFMSMQRRYYEDCLDDSELIGQTAECAGVEKTRSVLKKTDDVFGSVVPLILLISYLAWVWMITTLPEKESVMHLRGKAQRRWMHLTKT